MSVKESKYPNSKAEIIDVNNSSKMRNISRIQVSDAPKRHGSQPYVKISTKDYGKIKVIDGIEELYKTDGKETTKLFFTGGE